MTSVCIIGAFDTKAQEYTALRSLLIKQGFEIYAIDIGVFSNKVAFPIAVETASYISNLSEIRQKKDRPLAIITVKKGLTSKIREFYQAGRFSAVIGMGGTNGTEIITAAMRKLPDQLPKICISTVAQHDNWRYTKTSSVVLINPIVDISCDVNRRLLAVMHQTVGMLAGMITHLENSLVTTESQHKNFIVAISQFGTSTPCVSMCAEYLQARKFEVWPFHMVGTGGMAMERLIKKGEIDALLDITTTELADLYDNGVFSAGKDRLSAAIIKRIPHLFVPGCLDMTNLGPYEEVKNDPRFRNRILHQCTSTVTVMRTTKTVYAKIATHIINILKQANSPVAIMLPLKGLSMFDSPNNRNFHWYDPEANAYFFDEIVRLAKINCPNIPIYEIDYNINDPEFAHAACEAMLKLLSLSSVSHLLKASGIFKSSPIHQQTQFIPHNNIKHSSQFARI
jgi:uncharacterized protein (UPF0261 family)